MLFMNTASNHASLASGLFILLLLGLLVWAWSVIRRLKQEVTRLEATEREFEQAQIQQLIRSEKLDVENNRTKAVFLANISHELRTPLNIVIGYGEMIEEYCDSEQLTEPLEDTRKVLKASQELQKKINQMLELSRVESGRIEVMCDSFSTEALLSDLEVHVAQQLEASGNRLIVRAQHAPKKLYTDLGRLRQALLILLNNAIAFTRDGEIEIEAIPGKERPLSKIDFRFKDSGASISASLLPILFTGFPQLEEHSIGEQRGSGLELAICKSLCVLLGGDLSVESRDEAGCIFVASVPISLESQPPAANPESEREAGQPILLISPDKEDCEVLQKALEGDQYQLIIARDTETALTLTQETQPGLIIVDGMMPGTGGWQDHPSHQTMPLPDQYPLDPNHHDG